MARSKFDTETYSLAHELDFVRQIGFCSRVKDDPQDVLEGYRRAVEARQDWWPGFDQSQRQEILAAISERMEALANYGGAYV